MERVASRRRVTAALTVEITVPAAGATRTRRRRRPDIPAGLPAVGDSRRTWRRSSTRTCRKLRFADYLSDPGRLVLTRARTAE